jgi:hypothetical protein
MMEEKRDTFGAGNRLASRTMMKKAATASHLFKKADFPEWVRAVDSLLVM